MTQEKELTGAKRMEWLRRRIEHWRSSREKLEPMPARLWKEAVALARELGVYRVKCAVGVNYHSLQKHMEDERAASGGVGETPGNGFVELSGAQVLGLPEVGGPVVELCATNGVKVTVRFPAGSVLDLAELVKVFGGDGA